jgi:cell fate (sporulation/competence/biofilm development) regulator YlbF (YheA/YmcA/DUF963 family)
MALPKLNDTPKYDIVIPSTNKKVRYRPYLVREEKVLMMAMESQDMNAILNAVVDTITACVQTDIEKDKLTIFDVEYMFTQIRAKSVGETSKVAIKCKHCETSNEVSVDVSSIKIDVPKISNTIELTPEITLEMKWPGYDDLISLGIKDTKMMAQNAFAMIGKCIAAIHTNDERISTKDVAEAELVEFIDSMTKDQFQKVSTYIEQMPRLIHNIDFHCVNCFEINNIKLEGMSDFF